MLHDPSHRPQPITTEEIELQPDEKEVLRRLVAELAEIAALPITIKAARQVGGILKYAIDVPDIQASYAYYM